MTKRSRDSLREPEEQPPVGQFAKKAVEVDAKHSHCVVARTLVADFDDEDIVEFARLARERKWTVIQGALSQPVGVVSLRKHALGTCTCPKTAPAWGTNRG